MKPGLSLGFRDRNPGRLWHRIKYPAVRNHSGNGFVHVGFDPGDPEHWRGQHPARGAGDIFGCRFWLYHPNADRHRRLFLRTGLRRVL